MIGVELHMEGLISDCYENKDYTPVVEEIVKLIPNGFKTNERYIGNSMYLTATWLANSQSVKREIKEDFADYIFEHYRVNGLLETTTGIKSD